MATNVPPNTAAPTRAPWSISTCRWRFRGTASATVAGPSHQVMAELASW